MAKYDYCQSCDSDENPCPHGYCKICQMEPGNGDCDCVDWRSRSYDCDDQPAPVAGIEIFYNQVRERVSFDGNTLLLDGLHTTISASDVSSIDPLPIADNVEALALPPLVITDRDGERTVFHAGLRFAIEDGEIVLV